VIPFNKPVWLGTEIQRVTEAITSHGHVAGGGPFGKYCEQLLSRQLDQPALLVTSCTHSLEMAAMLLETKEGDEFIVPSYTFVSTANAFVLRGARPVFADVDRGGNLDPQEVARLLTRRTRAVVVVHYAGNSCDMRQLAEVCGRVPIVEDAAQAIGARFDGKPLGTFGVCGSLSFHETKNVGCGEGGALTLKDEKLLERAEYPRQGHEPTPVPFGARGQVHLGRHRVELRSFRPQRSLPCGAAGRVRPHPGAAESAL
jgi:dTDP-4-amino-4,6-dideoxygalactose transaminase